MAPAGMQDVFFAKFNGNNGSDEYLTGYGNTAETDANPIMLLYTPIGQTEARIVLAVSQSTDGQGAETNQTYFAAVSQPAGGGGVAPVEWLDFQAWQENGQVVLEWATATETNNDHFVIERSVEGTMYEAIGTVQGVGFSQQHQYYQAQDEFPHRGLNYYRIRQVDFDGTYSHSHVVELQIEVLQEVRVYPNPVADYINLEMTPMTTGEIAMGLYDDLGRPLFQRRFVQIPQQRFTQRFDLPPMAKGRYWLRIQADDQVWTHTLIVK